MEKTITVKWIRSGIGRTDGPEGDHSGARVQTTPPNPYLAGPT